jgi:uncharacterized membrane protein HdeD (DUF308 family)
MRPTTKLTAIESRIEKQFGLSRGILVWVGVASLVFGLVAMALPWPLFVSMTRLAGFVLLGSGAFKAVQLLVGRHEASARHRG